MGDHPFEYEFRSGPVRTYCSDKHAWKAAAKRAKERIRKLESRRCARCGEVKSREDFPGPSTVYCRPCHAEYSRERRKINGIDPAYTRMLNLRRYGLTPADFAARLASQDGRCAICRTDTPGGQGWHVDHDHTCCNTRKRSCGECTRGILCTRCNIGIGNFKDDPRLMKAAVSYILAYRDRRSQLF